MKHVPPLPGLQQGIKRQNGHRKPPPKGLSMAINQ